MANGGIAIGEWSGSDATRALANSIAEFNRLSSLQTEKIVRLTWALAIMTFVMVIEVAFQIWLALA